MFKTATDLFTMLKTSHVVLVVNICVLLIQMVLGVVFHDFVVWTIAGMIYLLVIDFIVLKKAQRLRKQRAVI